MFIIIIHGHQWCLINYTEYAIEKIILYIMYNETRARIIKKIVDRGRFYTYLYMYNDNSYSLEIPLGE